MMSLYESNGCTFTISPTQDGKIVLVIWDEDDYEFWRSEHTNEFAAQQRAEFECRWPPTEYRYYP